MGDMPADPVLTSVTSTLSDGSTSTYYTILPTLLNANMSHLGGPNPTVAALTPHQLTIVRIIAISSSTVTLVTAAFVLYWFARMKRNFRRQLIMILIFCDTWKALWSFIFPVVALTNYSFAVEKRFCSTTGFFFAMGIEAADFCILFIAIHSALCIFSPRSGPLSQAGLFRYRYFVYAFIFLVPVLLASLAFVNTAPAYVAQTTWCYLPVRPFWYRLALAWIPRYCIMISITSLYLSIYIYVKVTFKSYKAQFRTSELDTSTTQDSTHPAGRRGSNLSVFGATFKIPGIGKNERVREVDVGLDPHIVGEKTDSETTIPVDPDDLEINPDLGDIEKVHRSHSRLEVNGINRPRLISHAGHSKDVQGQLEDDRRGTQSTENSMAQMLSPVSRLTDGDLPPSANSEEALRQRQFAIQRQLRFLFIYPCVYVLIWLVPLVNHTLQYYERFAERPSFPLVVISAIAIPIQGAIDCFLFSLRERPWRLVQKHSKQPFVSWVLGRHWEEPSKEDLNIEAMDNVQRQAYLRREREKRENERAKAERVEQKQKRNRMGRKNSMTWWDTFDHGFGGDVSRQSSRQEGDAGKDGSSSAAGADLKGLTRNSSFGSFGSIGRGTIGRRRSRSGSDLWRNFTFSDTSPGNTVSGASSSTRPKLIRNKSSPTDAAACVSGSSAIPGTISAIEEHPEHQLGEDPEISPLSTALPPPASRDGDDNDEGLMMKKS